LYEIVDSRQRNPQVLGRLFYGKQIVNWSFVHSFKKKRVYTIVIVLSIIRIASPLDPRKRFRKSGTSHSGPKISVK
jgi:hypothetical protein